MRTNLKRPVILVAACVAWVAGCGGAETAVRPTTNAAPASNVTARLNSFGEVATRYSSADFESLPSTRELVGRAGFVVVGDVVGAVSGRKEFLGRGCADVDPKSEGGACKGNPDVPLYASYVNLVVRPRGVSKGKLQAEGSDVHVEFSWPNNLPIDTFSATAPQGSRVIVVGDAVADAKEKSKPLEAAGLATASSIAPNLITVPPYGLIVEGSNGVTVLPLAHNQGLAGVLKSKNERVQSFNDAAETLGLAAARQ